MPDQQATDSAGREPLDPDIDLLRARRRGLSRRGRGDTTVLAAIAAAGAISAAARYLVGQQWPTPGCLPASTVAVNVLGCALIGVLMFLAVWVTSTATRRLVNWRFA